MLDRDTIGFDLAVVGGGIAGLFGALAAADEGAHVVVLTKGPLLGSASYHAQGGVAATLGADDSVELHEADTHRAGRGLCRPSAVAMLTREAPERIGDLARLGVAFDDGLSLEGGHSRRRVAHADGAETGAAIARVLARRALEHPRIAVREGERALGIWRDGDRAVGVLTNRATVAAPASLLATGGAAALWRRTTNPIGSTGDGIALAWGAGAAVADLEFVQFHPTALVANGFLLSEALRGEGALLLDERGERFVEELAPRDVVARAIEARGTALLDLRPIDRSRFGSLMEQVVRAGYDPGAEPVPVAPAAHYTMGGIVTDLDGRTEVRGLYAAGECACTGVHGANRLASNSLLECLVFGRRAGLAALGEPALAAARPQAPAPPTLQPVSSDLREQLWQDAGVVRDAAGLERLRRSEHLLARLVAECALARTESRGGHFRADFPNEDPGLSGHFVLRPGRDVELEPWC
jgi:L-aspartate oxidase